MVAAGQKKPPKCCHPNCFNCPYKDCRWDQLTSADFTETNNRDYFLHRDGSGRALHKDADPEYRYKRQLAYQRENRKANDLHAYNQKYYQEHGEEIRKRAKESYDTAENTKKCRRYRKEHLGQHKEYDKAYYEMNKEKKRQQAREYYYRRKEATANA